jgi:hypothetical protein
MGIRNIAIDTYRTMSTDVLVQMKRFAGYELDDPAVEREHAKIMQVLDERGQNGDPE